MKRRTFLHAVGTAGVGSSVAAAGCTGPDGGGSGDGGDGDDGGDGTTASFPRRVVDVDPDPVDALDARVAVSLSQNFSRDAPAELAVELTNDTETSRTYQFGPVVPWSSLWGSHASAEATLVAVPGPVAETLGGDIVPPHPTDGCWRAKDGLVLPEYLQRKELAAGESVRHRYTLVGQHDDAECLPAGTYRFADHDYLGRAPWGFDVRIERD